VSTALNIDRLRSYASILSNSTFNSIVRNKDLGYIHCKINKYDKALIQDESLTYCEYFSYLFNSLMSSYRNEYIYKNLIINKILLGKYSLNTSTILDEFRINKSIADIVLINGTSKVFEIKTELDSPKRLATQIHDYKKVFKEIYIVTHLSLKDKYLDIIDKNVGLIVLTNNHSLKTIREPVISTEFDNLTIMKCLRKLEYSNIVHSYFGYLPQVTDFKYFNACKDLINSIPSNELHDLMLIELKKRTIREKEIFESTVVPKELKHICFCLDFNKVDYIIFKGILEKKITKIA
jgi:hypothetical protein